MNYEEFYPYILYEDAARVHLQSGGIPSAHFDMIRQGEECRGAAAELRCVRTIVRSFRCGTSEEMRHEALVCMMRILYKACSLIVSPIYYYQVIALVEWLYGVYAAMMHHLGGPEV
jgi:hypothetical protein